MIEPKTKAFQGADGEVFCTVNQLNGMKAAKLFFALAKKILPAALSGKMAPEQRNQAISAALESLSVEEFDRYTAELLKGQLVIRIPSKDTVEPEGYEKLGEVFRGEPLEIFKLIMFALEVNFGSFLKAGKEAPPVIPSRES